MTISYAGPQRTLSGTGTSQRLVNRPINRPANDSRSYHAGHRQLNRPGPSRPRNAPMRYSGTGVAVSTAPHARRPVTVATTVGLALLAGIITLWLGLMANFGSMVNGKSAEAAAGVPASLAVVRVEPGESLQQLAARVAPGAPVRDVVERIRNLNALDSNAVSAGQTLIAPIG